MYISKVTVQNFRILKNSTLDLLDQKDISLLIGRNNSGKTSFIVLFEKFLKSEYSTQFDFDDFSIDLRAKILEINEDTKTDLLSIRLILEISYDNSDSLENLADLILDLDPDSNTVKILFEISIVKDKLIKDLGGLSSDDQRKRFIKKNLPSYITSPKIYVFANDEDIQHENRHKMIEKDRKVIDNLINFQVIHAKRNVSSSESNNASKRILSGITTSYFNKKAESDLKHGDFDAINSELLSMDSNLGEKYGLFFSDFLEDSKRFLGINDLKVISDLESKEILSYHSKVVYGGDEEQLPEHLNGLGYMNILYLLLQLEIKKEFLLEGRKDINLLFIEEPEAHTHPQMQTIFIKKIDEKLRDIRSLQTFVTSHSSHIVKNCNFKDIRYFSYDPDERNIQIKNFYSELEEKYKNEEEQFKFLNQYLSIASSELFFAEKIIFIEGTTEAFLLPYFISEIDKNQDKQELKLSSQNITVLEAGANAKAFKHFIDFLDIRTLIITDIDTTKLNENSRYEAIKVKNGTHTSNSTITDFLHSPDFKDEAEFSDWFEKLKKNDLHDDNSLVRVVYQTEESGYHGRSFEDTFISINKQNLIDNDKYLEGNGLKKDFKKNLEELDYYDFTDSFLGKKSTFASGILWLALTGKVSWNIPAYIKEGLTWIAEKE